MIDESLRDRFHDLVNRTGLISVKSQEFSLLYGGDLKEIDTSTKDALFNALQEIESGYNKMSVTLDSLSKTLGQTIAQKDWEGARDPIINVMKDVHTLYLDIKNMSEKISDTNYKKDILNIAVKMKDFVELIESINQLVAGVREKLISYGIYDYVYDENGKVFIRVLYCDRSQPFNETVKTFFEHREFIVYTAQNSETALRIIRNHRPIIAFIDIKLEGISSGLDVLREIRQTYSKIKTVMVTVYDLDEIKEILAAEKLDADYCITKPADLDDLVAKARELTMQK